MNFDLRDVGEFLNDNPQIPIAAGLVAGQAVHRNVERARQDAAAIKNSLDAIQRHNDEAKRLALKKEQQEKALAANRDFLFRLSISLDRILSQGYTLAGYFEIEDLAQDLKGRNLTTASFAEYRDKKVLAEVEAKVAEAQRLFAQEINPGTRDQISEVIRWDHLASRVRYISKFVHELRANHASQQDVQAELVEVRAQKPLSLSQANWGPGLLLPAIMVPVLLTVLTPLSVAAIGASSSAIGALLLSPVILPAAMGVSEFLRQRKDLAQDLAGRISQLKCQLIALRQESTKIEQHLNASKFSVLNIHGIDPATLSFAASADLAEEQRGAFIKGCDEYVCNLLSSLNVSVSALPTIRRLRGF